MTRKLLKSSENLLKSNDPVGTNNRIINTTVITQVNSSVNKPDTFGKQRSDQTDNRKNRVNCNF